MVDRSPAGSLSTQAAGQLHVVQQAHHRRRQRGCIAGRGHQSCFAVHNVTAELIDLQNSAKRAANGDYAPITLNPENLDDEVSVLEEQFNLMLNKVRQREEKLKKQVEALTIQIDMEKRSKDVKEIVESEFFQDLKNRAATVRKQREQKS